MTAKKTLPSQRRAKTPVERHRSQTPDAGKEGTSKLMLRLGIKRKLGESSISAATSPGAHDRDAGAKVATPLTTRRGRQVRAPKFADAIYGDEFDAIIKETTNLKIKRGKEPEHSATSAVEGEVSLAHDLSGLGIDSSPAGSPVSNIDSGYDKDYYDRQDSVKPLLRTYNEHGAEVLEWDTTPNAPPQQSQSQSQQPGILNLDISSDTYKIFDALRASTETLVDLPLMSQPSAPTEDEPYTAKILTHLYLLCYSDQFWNGCDLIADTWIRALHKLRSHGHIDRARTKAAMLWRRNRAREEQQRLLEGENKRRRRLGKPELKGSGSEKRQYPEYGLVVQDPLLASDVPMYHRELVNAVYANTDEGCGARLLWADAMAQCGDAAGELIEAGKKTGCEWHAGLLYDVMQTALRMARKKLTLKIEEDVEGAWCKRYHEHAKHGLPCYREIAFREEQAAERESEAE